LEKAFKCPYFSLKSKVAVPKLKFWNSLYYIKITGTALVSVLEFTGENAEYAPYVNQNKTKMKIVLPEELPMSGDGKLEFILYSVCPQSRLLCGQTLHLLPFCTKTVRKMPIVR
jgi:hypothetical protein